MAYDIKDVFYLDTGIETTTDAGDGAQALDLSAYIDPIARGKSKATGLAIYKVHFDVVDDGGNNPVPPATNGQLRVALMSNPGITSAAVGDISFANDTLNAGNALVAAGSDYVFGGSAAGDPYQPQQKWLEPSKEVPYVVVRDSVLLAVVVGIAMGANTNVFCRLECAQISLDQATLNQLLRTQTV